MTLHESGTDDQDAVDQLVDEASMDSFPASDPPSHWARRSDESYIRSREVEANDPSDDDPADQG